LINLAYLKAELFRRKTKTILIAIGLGVPIALTIVVGAYSTGLGNAQDKVLEPLVGLGTDMTVTKPASFNQAGGPGQGGPRFGFGSAKAGEKFTQDRFVSGGSATFSSDNVAKVKAQSDVSEVAGGLTLTNLKVSGTIPDQASGGGQGGPGGGAGQGGGAAGGPSAINIDTKTVTGIDPSSDLGPITSDQLQKGAYLADNDAKEAVISSTYAKSKKLAVGDTVKLKTTSFKIVGVVSTPLTGNSSDVYVKLAQLQKIADLEGKVNTVYVRAATQDDVTAVSKEVKTTIAGATVTTNSSLASQVGGSLVDAKKLVDKMGVFLELILLLAAVVITTILTLNAVNKRTREFGTLKSIGWANPRLVKQVMAESLSTGLIGAAVGVVLGGIATLATKAVPLTLKVTGNSSSGAGAGRGGFAAGGPPGGGAPPGGGGFQGPPGARQAASAASQTITVHPSISLTTILIAAAIGAITALIAGGVGALKTSRLSPVEALKHVD
jgi:putative ABC transport system permease protein